MIENKEKLKRDMTEAIKQMVENKDLSVTVYFKLDYDDENVWAIVFGWMDGFEKMDSQMTEDIYRICGKCAYMSNRSLMSEYDIDWNMPIHNNSGDVDDTEISFNTEDDISTNLDWLMSEFERYQKEYIHPEKSGG